MTSIFNNSDLEKTIQRVKALTPETKALWGKMDVAQMLAHCNVTFELAYEDIHPKPGAFKKFLLKMFVKKAVVGPKPYPKNGPTAPQFKITSTKDFNKEQSRLIEYLTKTHALGADHIEGRDYHSFGTLTSKEWDVMFTKHLDHHLQQFGQ
jgi:hypothetical protein